MQTKYNLCLSLLDLPVVWITCEVDRQSKCGWKRPV